MPPQLPRPPFRPLPHPRTSSFFITAAISDSGNYVVVGDDGPVHVWEWAADVGAWSPAFDLTPPPVAPGGWIPMRPWVSGTSASHRVHPTRPAVNLSRRGTSASHRSYRPSYPIVHRSGTSRCPLAPTRPSSSLWGASRVTSRPSRCGGMMGGEEGPSRASNAYVRKGTAHFLCPHAQVTAWGLESKALVTNWVSATNPSFQVRLAASTMGRGGC